MKREKMDQVYINKGNQRISSISNKEFLIELIVDKLLNYRKKIQTASISIRKTKYYDVFYERSILYRRVRLSVISFNNCSCPCSSSKSARERLKKFELKILYLKRLEITLFLLILLSLVLYEFHLLVLVVMKRKNFENSRL